MGATKTDFYSDDLIKMANLFKALGHPARLEAFIMMLKSTDKDITQKDIADVIGLSQSTLSVHLNKLVQAGVTKQAVTSQDKKSCLAYRANSIATDFFIEFFDLVKKKSDIKVDEKFEKHNPFYSGLISVAGWNNCFQT